MLKTAEHYRTMETANLLRLYKSAEERSERATSDAAYLSDEFAMQEISEVLIERKAFGS